MRLSTGCTPIRSRKLFWHSTARAFLSTSASRPDDGDKWHRLLVQHHLQQQLDSSEAVDSAEEEAAQHAHNQLRWIRQAAADQDHVVARMVTELVQLDKPLAYVLGTQPFHPLPVELLVRPPTLIPRPETEHWLNQLIDRLGGGPPPLRILDIGTGSGCIALGLTYALRNQKENGDETVQTVAVDQSAEALALAQENAHRCNLVGTLPGVTTPRDFGPSNSAATAAAAPISFVLANLFSPTFTSSVLSALRGASSSSSPSPSSWARFDLVVSNPPYIPLHEYETLDASVREWEDRKALVGERPPPVVEPAEGRSVKTKEDKDDGLVFYRRIISLLDTLLEPPPPPSSLRSDTSSPNSYAAHKERAIEQEAPCVAFEVGKGQARAVEQLLRAWRPSSPRTTTHHDDSLSTDPDSKGQQQLWGLETEVVVDPWGVERAVFARWARRKARKYPRRRLDAGRAGD